MSIMGTYRDSTLWEKSIKSGKSFARRAHLPPFYDIKSSIKNNTNLSNQSLNFNILTLQLIRPRVYSKQWELNLTKENYEEALCRRVDVEGEMLFKWTDYYPSRGLGLMNGALGLYMKRANVVRALHCS
jgi:hypothetical protein